MLPDNGTRRRITEPAGRGGGEDKGVKPAGNGLRRGRAADSGVLGVRVISELPPGTQGLPPVGLGIEVPRPVPDPGAKGWGWCGEVDVGRPAPASLRGWGTLGSEE